MDIRKYDPAADLGEIAAMLDGKEGVLSLFQKSLEKFHESTYIARYEEKIAGILSFNKFDSRRVDLVFYVDEKYRCKGIVSKLIQFFDQLIADSPFEYAYCSFTADERTADFLTKNGYRLYCSSFDMERDSTLIDSDKLSDVAILERGIVIRNYRDEDYISYHNVSDVAFYLLREKLGLKPSYYLPPLKEERERLARVAANRYVMIVGGVMAAIGAVTDHGIHLLAVRPDLQHQGYGRMMASYLNNKIITERKVQKVKISVTNGNPAKRLYESIGFRDVRFAYDYIKYYKPDSRQAAPKGYESEEEILKDLKLYGKLSEEFVP